MKDRIISTDLKKHIGKKVIIAGWIHNIRELGKITFVLVRDRGGIIQVVITDKKLMKKVSKYLPETVVKIEGTVADAEGKTDLGAELQAETIEIISPVTEPTPVTLSHKDIDAKLETILDHRPITLRHPKQKAIFKVQAGILQAFAESMRKQGFTEFRNPVLMGAPSESGASVFEVKYFDDKAYLCQSPQLYKQMMVGVFEKVFTVTPVFRAEKHTTTRHLMEITQLDGEMAFIDSYDDVLDVCEQVITDILSHLKKNHSEDLKLWDATLPKVPKGGIPQIKVKEALEIIEKRLGKKAKGRELDLDPEDEREIGKWCLEEHDSDFVWLLNYKSNKNFYTWDSPDDEDESLSYDLVCRGLEWLSGTHRIHEYDALHERFKKQGLKEEHFEHYLETFKYGMPPEAGFSFGLERMTQQIFGFKNIREATLFPSDLVRIAGARRKPANKDEPAKSSE